MVIHLLPRIVTSFNTHHGYLSEYRVQIWVARLQPLTVGAMCLFDSLPRLWEPTRWGSAIPLRSDSSMCMLHHFCLPDLHLLTRSFELMVGFRPKFPFPCVFTLSVFLHCLPCPVFEILLCQAPCNPFSNFESAMDWIMSPPPSSCVEVPNPHVMVFRFRWGHEGGERGHRQ